MQKYREIDCWRWRVLEYAGLLGLAIGGESFTLVAVFAVQCLSESSAIGS
jgi:hypothetical protein